MAPETHWLEKSAEGTNRAEWQFGQMYCVLARAPVEKWNG
jgi:hypothetical protein